MSKNHQLVLIRHGESIWNKENRFTGWVDVDLSEKGLQEAKKAASELKKAGFTFDLAYTSLLKRAIRTLWTIQEEMDLMWLPVLKSWRLNERHYGSLQGLNKTEMAQKYGEEQVHIWRRSYDTPPPALERSSPEYPGNDPRYQDIPVHEIPVQESLKMTVARVIPYWEKEIAPQIKSGKRVIIAAHGNSLRALIKYLDNLGDQAIVERNIPTAIPLIYELDSSLKPIRSNYLGDPSEIEKAIHSVAKQGKK